MNSALLAFLFFDVFLLGIVVTLALRHGLAHFKPEKHDAEKLAPKPAPAQGAHLPPAVREHLLEVAQTDFQSVLRRSAEELEQDLDATSEDIKKLLKKMGSEAIGKELERSRAKLSELEQQTEAEMSGINQELASHKQELKTKLEADIEAEKQKLLAQIDTKLADAVASFLIETLGHNVDLGAQSAYLTSVLEDHKDDFKKEASGE